MAAPADAKVVLPPKAPFAQLEVVDALEGIASTNPKTFGTAQFSGLVTTMYRASVEEVSSLRAQIATLSATVSELQTQNAVQVERLETARRLKWGKHFAQAFGTVAVGFGVKLFGGPYESTGWGILFFGILLIIGFWFIDGLKASK